ncbi:pyridoxal-phosphate dependent enzyme [Agarivorans sp. QJM3NY_25]|uniref:pyridoxal-phosphate dependent enzyme n=1 Tax=Agarivorans sp. QJM3NY_25 TaxID=3421430 RepID=UPI003D7DB855
MSEIMEVLTPDSDVSGSLRKKAKIVTDFDDNLRSCVNNLHASLNDVRHRLGFGRALAAPQTGLSLRIIVVNLGAAPITLINPEITWRSDAMQSVWDDCLSTPELIVKIQRHQSISLKYQNIHGEFRDWNELPADYSELLQHEYEHLDGVLMIDHAKGDNVLPSAHKSRVCPPVAESRISLSKIQRAHQHINPLFTQSRLFRSSFLSQACKANIWLKDETDNPIACFKGRGAEHYLSTVFSPEDKRPIVCASAGNWGLALAWSCQQRKRPLEVFVPSNANPLKVSKIKALGAKIQHYGDDFDSAKEQAKLYSQQHAYCFLEDGKEVAVSEGAGSIGVELLSKGQHFDAVYIPLGNGALINGVARWVKASSPSTQIIGVVPKGADSMYCSWLQSRAVERDSVNTIADGLAVRSPIPEAVMDMQGLVDKVILVDDPQIQRAMEDAETADSLRLEPSGAVAIAGVIAMSEEQALQGHIAVLLTGANRG